jgi:hypothetical protein
MRIAVIPDTQVKPGVDLTYLGKIGEYLVEKQPDVIIHLGDHWDMPSLSSYDVGKKSFEGRRYKNDIQAGNDGMRELLYPLKSYNKRAAANHKPRYRPEMHFLMGNHENRINRAVNDDAKLEGTIGVQDCNLDDWIVHDFLDVAIIGGIAFSHYFVTGVAGRPASTASAQLNKKHMSCIAGHQQGLQIATAHRADGQRLTSIIAGSCYEHDEDYLGHQGNKHWRGFMMLHEVNDGQFDLMPVSLDYLNKKYK